MTLRSLIIGISLLFICVAARSEPPGLDPDSERLMELLLSDSTVLNNSLSIFPVRNEWVLPLGALSESLGFAINYSSTLSQADGFVIDESRHFHLDVARCEVQYEGRKQSYPCKDVLSGNDEIYVKAYLIERWFPINVMINSFRSQLVIFAREKLPEQLKRERESEAERAKSTSAERDPGYPRYETPRLPLDGPFIDEQLDFTRRTISGVSGPRLQHNTQISGELLGLETYGLMTGDLHGNAAEQYRFSLARKDDRGGIFGPLNLRQAQFFSVDMPPIPLLTDIRPSKGFLLSNFPLNTPTNYQRTDFQGPLAPGWEVDLYQNGVLLRRQTTPDGTGRYFFKNIPLFYGRNLFRLVFYGPHGERRDEYRTFNVVQSLVPPGSSRYRMGFGNTDDTGHQRATLEYNQNLGGPLTAMTGLLYDAQAAENYAYAGLLGVSDLFLFSMNCAAATHGGKACEWDQQMGVGTATLGAKYTRLFGFRSDLFNLVGGAGGHQTSQIEGNLNYVLPLAPAVAMYWEAIRRNYDDNTVDTLVRNRLSLNSGDYFFNNEIEYTFDAAVPLIGKWEVSYIPEATRYTLGAEYGKTAVTALDAEIQYTDPDAYSITALFKYPLNGQGLQTSLTASRLFPGATVGVELAYTDRANYYAGMLLAFSAARDSRTGDWKFNKYPQAQYGSASVLVYVDENHNGQYDPGERRVENLKVAVDEARDGVTTDNAGLAYLAMLRPYVPIDLTISTQSLEDPFLRLENKGVRIYVRPGKVTQVGLPLVVVGQADGMVVLVDNGVSKPKRGVFMELVDADGVVISHTKTDRDGFFSFDSVSPGRYRVRIAAGQRLAQKWTSTPESHDVVIPKEGSFESGKDFTLSTIAP